MITSIITIIAGISHILSLFAVATIETLTAFSGSVAGGMRAGGIASGKFF